MWRKQIRVMYDMTLITFSFIIWNLIACMMWSLTINYRGVPIIFACVFLFEFLNDKEVDSRIAFAISLFILLIGNIILFSGGELIGKVILSIICLMVVYVKLGDGVNYESYSQSIKPTIYMFLVVFILGLADIQNLLEPLYRAVIVYFVLAIITLREAQKYTYNLKEKRSNIVNVFIIGFTFLISTDFVGEYISKLAKGIGKILLIILDFLVGILYAILYYPLSYLLKLLMGKDFAKRYEDLISQLKLVNPTGQQTKVKAAAGNQIIGVIIEYTFKVLICILILYIVYKILLKVKKIKGKNEYETFDEKIEKIEKDQRNKNRSLIKKIKERILTGQGTIKEQIRFSFKQYEEKVNKIKIYRPYFTATQLKNLTKINTDKHEELEKITFIYNKAKFSSYESSKEELNEIKNAVKEVKNNIKKQ